MKIDGTKIIEECNEQMGPFSSIPSLSNEKSDKFSKQLPNAIPAFDSILSAIEEQEKTIWNINNSVVNFNINISSFNPYTSSVNHDEIKVDAEATIKKNQYIEEKTNNKSNTEAKGGIHSSVEKPVEATTHKRKLTVQEQKQNAKEWAIKEFGINFGTNKNKNKK
jgi:hypothetical protein